MRVCVYIYIYTHIERERERYCYTICMHLQVGGLGGVFFGPDGLPCVVLWRPQAQNCRVLIPPETWNRFTRNPPSFRLGFNHQRRGVQIETETESNRSKPKRLRHVARCRQRVQHGSGALKIEAASRPKYRTMLKSN